VPSRAPSWLKAFVFNTVLGEELLFRGVLLPRMSGAFGKADWVANGVLHVTYHLHMPWVIPASINRHLPRRLPRPPLPQRPLQLVVHSGQTVMFTILLLTLVV
jgi:membrane protease YdiL (CAAX protease family)